MINGIDDWADGLNIVPVYHYSIFECDQLCVSVSVRWEWSKSLQRNGDKFRGFTGEGNRMESYE